MCLPEFTKTHFLKALSPHEYRYLAQLHLLCHRDPRMFNILCWINNLVFLLCQLSWFCLYLQTFLLKSPVLSSCFILFLFCLICRIFLPMNCRLELAIYFTNKNDKMVLEKFEAFFLPRYCVFVVSKIYYFKRKCNLLMFGSL